MSDTAKAFIVVLDSDVSEEETEQMRSAFLRFRGVIGVEPHTHDIADVIAAARARHRLTTSVYEFLRSWK